MFAIWKRYLALSSNPGQLDGFDCVGNFVELEFDLQAAQFIIIGQ